LFDKVLVIAVMNKLDIIKTLHEISHNEHEKYKAFKDRLVDYCTNKKKAVTILFRLLRTFEMELSECLNGQVKINVDRAIIIKVLKTIRIEIEIIRYRMKHPDLFEKETSKSIEPVGVWTSDKNDLVELIVAIKGYISHGKVSIKTLQEAFEYIFHVELGDIDERLKEIEARKGNKAQFLERLIHSLNKIHIEFKAHESHKKIKWTGNLVYFVELVYALEAAGYINDGKATLSELFHVLCEVFDIEVKDFSRTFRDIKNRAKGDRTKIFDELKQALLRKLKVEDEKPPRK